MSHHGSGNCRAHDRVAHADTTIRPDGPGDQPTTEPLRIILFYGGEAATQPREALLTWLRSATVADHLQRSVEARKVSDWPAHSGATVDARVSEAITWADKAIVLVTPDPRGVHGAPNVLEETGRWREKKGGESLVILRHRDVPVHSNQAGIVYIGYHEHTTIVDECHERLLAFLQQAMSPREAVKQTVQKSAHPNITFVILFAMLAILLVIVGIQFWPLPQPMESGEWNIAVAGMGITNTTTNKVEAGLDGEQLSNQIEEVLAPHAADTRKWNDPGVGFTIGDAETRLTRAETIADELDASVVVYGVIEHTIPEVQATFTPEFYIHDTETFPTFDHASEILGPEQFGTPVTYTLGITGGDANVNTAMEERLTSLKDFIRGLQLFLADDYTSARSSFCQAIFEAELIDERCVMSNDPIAEDQTSHTAVVHLYLGALELQEGNLPDALRHATTAQTIWPAYPRPLITKGALFFRLANTQYEQRLAERYRPPADAVPLPADQTCAATTTMPNLTIEDNLALAARCYEEAQFLAGNSNKDFVSTMDIELKALLSRGNIAFLRADLGETVWQDAQNNYKGVTDEYEYIKILEQEQRERWFVDTEQIQKLTARAERIQRLAAHAYARQGLILICKPHCTKPQQKSIQVYQQAQTYYEQALDLLQTTEACQQDIEQCLIRDRASIEAYQQQLEEINKVLIPPDQAHTAPPQRGSCRACH